MEGTQYTKDRVAFFEEALLTAEATYIKNPLDVENLTRWAVALLELSQYQIDRDTKIMLEDATSKLEEALVISPKNPDALSVLGNVHHLFGFTIPDPTMSRYFFEKATQCYQQALEEDPGNEIYLEFLEVVAKAPERHMETYGHLMGQQTFGGGGGPSASSNAFCSGCKKKDFTYAVCGCIILGIGIIAWVQMVKSLGPPPRR